MCKVLTQNGTRLLDVSNVDIYITKVSTGNKHFFDVCIFSSNSFEQLGTYRTEERAKEVLRLAGIYLGRSNYYEMPEIDDFPQACLEQSADI